MARKIGELFYELRASSSAIEADLQDAERQLGKFTDFVKQNPVVAVTGLAAAFAGVAFAASQASAKIQSDLRIVTNTLNATDAEAVTLQEDLRDLSLESGRSRAELVGLFKAIAEGGPNGAANVRAIADAAIALSDVLGGSADANAGALDLVTDVFALDPANAREIAAVIASITEGRVPLGDVFDALSKIGPEAAALGLSFETVVSFLTRFIDQGFSVKRTSSLFKELADKGAEGRAEIERLADVSVDTAAALDALNTKQEAVIQSQEKQYEILRNRLNDQWLEFGNRALPPATAALQLLNNILDGTYARLLGVGDGADRAVAGLLRVAEQQRALTAASNTANSGRDAADVLGLRRGAPSPLTPSGPLFGGGVSTSAAPVETQAAQIGRRLAAIQSATKDLERLSVAQLRANARELEQIIALNTNDSQVEKAKSLQETIATAITAKTKEIATESAKASREIDKTREAASALFAQFGDQSAANRGAAAIAAWEQRAIAAGDSAAEVTRIANQLRGALDLSLRTDAAGKAAEDVERLAEQLRTLQAEASGDAVQILDASYAKITEELLRQAAAAEEAAKALDAIGDDAGASKARGLAAGFRAAADSAVKQKEQLTEVAKLAQRAAEARKTENDFAKAGNATYQGQVSTLADLRRAEAERVRITGELNALINDPTTDPKVRAAAQQVLNDLTRDQKTEQQGVTTEVQKQAQIVSTIGLSLRTSALAALSLVQILGDGNKELAGMLAGVVSVSDGIAGIGAAAEQAGGFKALFTSGKGIASALGPITALVGGATAIFGAISKSREEEKRRAEELKAAAERFTRNLGEFVRDIAEVDAGEFARARATLAERIGRLLNEAAAAAGYDPKSFEGTRQSSASLQGVLDTVNAKLADLQERMESASAYELPSLAAEFARLSKFADGLRETIGAAADAEADLAARQRDRIRVATEDLAVRRLEAIGQSDAAAALRDRLAAEREIEEAIKDLSGAEGYEQYIESLREVIELQIKAAAATRRLSEALKQLDDLETFFPELTSQGLSGLTATGARVWPEIFNTLFADLDLSTQEGLKTARQRIRDLYQQIAADGIDDTERPLIDFLKRFFGAIEDAIGDAGDPILNAIEAFNAEADALGLSSARRFQGLGNLLRLNTPGLDKILGPTFQQDINSEAGRTALIARLRRGITDITGDGVITDAERPLLEALQQLLDLVLSVVEETADEAQQAADDAEKEAERIETARQKRLKTRSQNAQLDIALGNLEGVDAINANLGQYTDAFRAFFGQFDVSTPEGIAAAATRLKEMRRALDQMTDEEILAKFGMTRDEVIAALLDIDGGLDGLATALEDLAERQTDFTNDINVQYLEAMGRGFDAVKLQTQLWVDSMIAQATALGLLTPALEGQIRAIANARIAAAAARDQAPVEVARAVATPTRATRNTQVVGDFGGLSALAAETLAGLQREAVVWAAQTARATQGLYDLFRLGLPAPPVSLLAYAGGNTAAGVTTTGGLSIGSISITIGALAAGGLTPTEAGRATLDAIVEHIGRLASQETRFLGSARR